LLKRQALKPLLLAGQCKHRQHGLALGRGRGDQRLQRSRNGERRPREAEQRRLPQPTDVLR
jgi:hypothetical protein